MVHVGLLFIGLIGCGCQSEPRSADRPSALTNDRPFQDPGNLQSPSPAPASRPAPTDSITRVGDHPLIPRGRWRVGEVDGTGIFAEEVFPRLYLAYYRETSDAVRQVIIERLASSGAKEHGVTVTEEAVEKETQRVLAQHESNLRSASKGAEGLKEFVESTLGIAEKDFLSWVRRGAEISLILERLIRFELSRCPRAEVRLIRVKSRELAQELVEKLRRGASFPALARQHSVDPSAAEGGAYPMLPLDQDSPLLERTRGMSEGELSAVEEVELADGTQFRILQLVKRLDSDPRSYQEMKDDIEDGLERRPVSSLELDAWMRTMERNHQIRLLGAGVPEDG